MKDEGLIRVPKEENIKNAEDKIPVKIIEECSRIADRCQYSESVNSTKPNREIKINSHLALLIRED